AQLLRVILWNIQKYQLTLSIWDQISEKLVCIFGDAIQLLCEQEQLRCARLCLLESVRQVLNNGLAILGVSAPESM
ncbi:DALR anticodon-binding domain-containing protein, partial [Legionella pneumophila]|uniref:DALR anticodon-binding domain-containing protein n=1 Tax=Legionella pneumophila TaxID=446 RepID=UPI001FF818B7